MEAVVLKAEIERATKFTFQCHAGQTRKDGFTPYIVHPFEVYALLRRWGITCATTLKAGIAHDVREECPKISYESLVTNIGKSAADVCEELSFFPDETSNVPVSKQKEVYIETFFEKSVQALVIKCADRICNTLDFWVSEPKYAPKYFKKGDPIFNAMMSREEEIVKTYGDEVFTQMKFSRDNVRRILLM